MTQLARRQLLTSLAGVPLAGIPLAAMPLATILADARLARAAADQLESVSLTMAGGRQASAALALPASLPAPSVLLIHEWWGLNDQIKTMAAEFAREGYVGLAVDLYGGQVADNPDDAKALMGGVDSAAATDTLVSWVDWLKGHEQGTGKVATIGWCFGGGWSLNASIATPVDATVIYYGRVDRPAADLKSLKSPVQGHFATEDQWINQEMVGGFEAAMAEAGKEVTSYWYEAQHAFANPSGGRYDEADAKLAWQRTLAFLDEHLKA